MQGEWKLTDLVFCSQSQLQLLHVVSQACVRNYDILMTILMSNLNSLIGFLVGVLGFLFLFWRRLKEFYTSDQIFTFGFILFGALILGSLLPSFIVPQIPPSHIFFPPVLLFFLGRSIVAFNYRFMLSFIGKADAIISIIVSFLFFLSLYNLSGRL